MRTELIDHMGDDLAVVNAARVSFAKESNWQQGCCGQRFDGSCCGFPELELKEEDARLIRYLAKHNHWTPFSHTAIKLRMSAPVPIRTQCFKHKQGFVENEESRRYISERPELFIPASFRSAPTGSIKQGSGDTHPNNDFWLIAYKNKAEAAIDTYQEMIADGVAPEQARLILPQGVEVNWIWTGNLYSFANFYKKRSDPHAQKEIQELASKVDEIIRPLFPVSWGALVDK